jgi:hypothetical protein
MAHQSQYVQKGNRRKHGPAVQRYQVSVDKNICKLPSPFCLALLCILSTPGTKKLRFAKFLQAAGHCHVIYSAFRNLLTESAYKSQIC